MDYKYLIEEQEEEDRFITSSLITDILTGKGYSNVTCEPTPITCSVDLNCSCTANTNKIDFNVEIKKNNKTEEQLKIYPHALLKKDKLIRMLNCTPSNYPLYYIILLNEKESYIFNVRTIDWNKVELVNLTQKRTQMNPNSGWIKVPTYRIPYKLGKKINIEQYYANYKLK